MPEEKKKRKRPLVVPMEQRLHRFNSGRINSNSTSAVPYNINLSYTIRDKLQLPADDGGTSPAVADVPTAVGEQPGDQIPSHRATARYYYYYYHYN